MSTENNGTKGVPTAAIQSSVHISPASPAPGAGPTYVDTVRTIHSTVKRCS